MKVKALSYWTACTIFNVSKNCSSVSLGKPTIISVESAKLGMAFFIFSTSSKYCLDVYLLPILCKISSLPDWTGKWIAGMMFGYLAITWIISSLKSQGWEVVKRIRGTPINAAFSKSVLKDTPLGKSFP